MTGKLDPAHLADFLAAVGADDPSVIQGAAYGEDAAAIDLGDRTLVVSSDPLSLAAERAGELGVHVACNDVAASGADPRWLTNTVFLPQADPDSAEAEATRETLVRQLDKTTLDAGVAIVGGHTEYLPQLDRPLLAMTAMGVTEEFVPSGGAEPGDRVLLTKGAGIEATAILATDFAKRCRDEGVSEETLVTAEGFFDEISVIPDAAVLRRFATAMHDPTEGGVLGALYEMATAADVNVELVRADVPVRRATRVCCEAVGVDPLRTFGSGALLATVPPDRVDEALSELAAIDVEGGVIGEVVGGSASSAPVTLDSDPISEPPRDELYPLWE